MSFFILKSILIFARKSHLDPFILKTHAHLNLYVLGVAVYVFGVAPSFERSRIAAPTV
jgi:hypothetical protein